MPKGLPELPPDWEYVDMDAPPETPKVSPKKAKSDIHDLLNAASPVATAPPSAKGKPMGALDMLLGPAGPLPAAKAVAKAVVPTDPVGIGLTLAAMILPGGPLAGVASRGLPAAVPMMEALTSSGIRRVATMTGLGGAIGGASGEGAGTGAAMGFLAQLPGEGLSKLTQWLRGSDQARALAQADPEALGAVVSEIIPNLGDMRSARDFHLAFKRGAAQRAAGTAYTDGMAQVAAQAPPQIVSPTMASIRLGGHGLPQTNRILSGPQAQGTYSFDDMAETLRRLRYEGWNEGERLRGLNARDARQAADALEQDIMGSLPPHARDIWEETNANYGRAKQLINFMDDKDLVDRRGNLNIAKLQQRFKAEGYNTGASYQMAADAAALEETLFRGADTMGEDVPGVSHPVGARFHLGLLPSLHKSMPQLATYAGRERYGLSPMGGNLVTQMLARGVSNRPRAITLAAPDDEE